MGVEKLRAAGQINVLSIESKPYDDATEFTISDVNVTEEFSGDLTGVGSVRFIMVNDPEGVAHFAGMERFLGQVGERTGSFILRNSGTLKDGVLHSEWLVIPGSGTDGLAGMRGEGGCGPEGYLLEYWFE
jgi:hypothetical protein